MADHPLLPRPPRDPTLLAEHGDLIEEFSALHTAHQAAYDPTGPATGPSEWHQALANTRARLQLWVARTGCRVTEHRAPVPPAWATTGEHAQSSDA